MSRSPIQVAISMLHNMAMEVAFWLWYWCWHRPLCWLRRGR